MSRSSELLALADRAEKGETGFSFERDIATALDYKMCFAAPERGTPPRWSISLDAQESLGVTVWSVTRIDYLCGPANFIVEAGAKRPLSTKWGEAPTEKAARLSAILRALAQEEKT